VAKTMKNEKFWILRGVVKLKNFLLNLFFPIECLGCRKEGEWICGDCSKTILLNIKE
jgi:hypothetical protein